MKRWLNNKKKNTTIVYYEGKIGNYIDNTLSEEKKKKKKTLEFYQGLSFITAILGYLLSLITNPWISAIGMLIAISSFLVIAWSRYKYEPDDFHEYMLVLGVYFAVLGCSAGLWLFHTVLWDVEDHGVLVKREILVCEAWFVCW